MNIHMQAGAPDGSLPHAGGHSLQRNGGRTNLQPAAEAAATVVVATAAAAAAEAAAEAAAAAGAAAARRNVRTAQ